MPSTEETPAKKSSYCVIRLSSSAFMFFGFSPLPLAVETELVEVELRQLLSFENDFLSFLLLDGLNGFLC